METTFEGQNLHPEPLFQDMGWIQPLAKSLVFEADSVDDVLQEAWVAALQSDQKKISNPKPWFGGVIKNVSRQSLRAEKRRRRRERSVSKHEALPSTAQVVAEEELKKKVVQKVLSLGEPYRSTLLLRFFECLTAEQIAKKEAIPSSTVRNRIKRGLDHIRDQFDHEFEGNRRSWSLSLIPLAVPSQGVKLVTAGSILSVLSGVLLMSSKMKIIALSVIIFGALGGYWFFNQKEDHPHISKTLKFNSNLKIKDKGASPQKSGMSFEDEELGGVGRGFARERIHTNSFRLKVYHSDGSPAIGGRVVLFNGEEIFWVKDLNEKGEASFPSLNTEAELLVANVFYPYYYQKIKKVQGELKLTFPKNKDKKFKGRLKVKGRSPEKRIKISLGKPFHELNEDLSDSIERFPLKIREAILKGSTYYLLNQETDLEGRFCFSGLPRSFRTSLNIPQEYIVLSFNGDTAGDESLRRTVDSDYLSENNVIDLAPRGIIAGRVVMDAVEPVIGAHISLIEASNNMVGFNVFDAKSGEEGNFKIPILVDEDSTAAVFLINPSGSHFQIRELGNLDLDERYLLGEIELVPGFSQGLKVVDNIGLPVSNATVEILDGTGRSFTPTNKEGYINLSPLITNDFNVNVHALGFESKSFSGSALNNVLEVQLDRCGLIEFLVTSKDGPIYPKHFDPNKGYHIKMSGQTLFPLGRNDDGTYSVFSKMEREGYFYSAIVRGDGWEFSGLPSRKGKLVLNCFPENFIFNVELVNNVGQVLESLKGISLGKEEVKKIHWEIDPDKVGIGKKTVFGKVVDDRGEPISGVDLGFRPKAANYTDTIGVKSGDEGNYQIKIRVGDEFEKISIKKEGFISQYQENLKVGSFGVPLNFQLFPEEVTDLKVVGKDGLPIDVDFGLGGKSRIEISSPGAPKVYSKRVSTGAYRIHQMITGVTYHGKVWIGGIEHAFNYRVGQDPPTIQIGPYGSLTVAYSGLTENWNWYIFVENLKGDILIKRKIDPLLVDNLDGSSMQITDGEADSEEQFSGKGEVILPALFPGSYRIAIRGDDLDENELLSPISILIKEGKDHFIEFFQ